MPPVVIRSALALLALTVCAYASVLPHQTIVESKTHPYVDLGVAPSVRALTFVPHKAVRTSVSSRILVKSSTAASRKTEEQKTEYFCN